MTFYGKDPDPKVSPRIKDFMFRLNESDKPRQVKAHQVYFYESGHVGFWNDLEDGDRELVLAVKAFDIWEEV